MRVPGRYPVRPVALSLFVLVAAGAGAQHRASNIMWFDGRILGDFDGSRAAVVRNAEQGDPEAQYELGRWSEIGDPFPVYQDEAEAAKWYRLAAEQGHAAAQDRLGTMYLLGTRSVPRDEVEAAKWYRRAAEQGHAGARHSLGHVFYRGEGVPQDYAEGAKWYRLAAEQGHGPAQYSLGLRYSLGEGVPQDLVQAFMWLHLAATSRTSFDSDRDEAAQFRDLTGELLSAEDRARALALAREWKPSP